MYPIIIKDGQIAYSTKLEEDISSSRTTQYGYKSFETNTGFLFPTEGVSFNLIPIINENIKLEKIVKIKYFGFQVEFKDDVVNCSIVSTNTIHKTLDTCRKNININDNELVRVVSSYRDSFPKNAVLYSALKLTNNIQLALQLTSEIIPFDISGYRITTINELKEMFKRREQLCHP